MAAMHPALVQWRDHLETLRWSAMAVDADWRLTWVTSELKQFLNSAEDEDVGIGKHVLDVLETEAWQTSDESYSNLDYVARLASYVRSNIDVNGAEVREAIKGSLAQLVESVDPAEIPFVDSGSTGYLDPRVPDAPPLRVNLCMNPIRDANGAFVGGVVIFFMDVPPTMLSLLGRGDQEMYERMARLVEPSQHRSAILFADVAESGRLSKELSNSAYFKLIRSLWTEIDRLIVEHSGIVGKHAGDGVSAYFLVTDLGTTEDTATAALRTARRIHEVAREVLADVIEPADQMRIGVHWAGSLYMGQLVPGSRLEVTALGDEVNETARIESCALPGQTLASKHVLQQLGPDKAAELGIDMDKIRFTIVSDLWGVNEKASRDAGSIPVTAFE